MSEQGKYGVSAYDDCCCPHLHTYFATYEEAVEEAKLKSWQGEGAMGVFHPPARAGHEGQPPDLLAIVYEGRVYRLWSEP